MFYPNDEISVPFKNDLDESMVSFVICLRVSELVGFESIEQYLPHRVAMQFGMDQDVPDCVPRFNETKIIAWKNYCRRPIYDTGLYFPSRFSVAGVTTRYEKWWKRSASSSKCRDPKLVGTVTFGKPCGYGSKTWNADNIVDDAVPSGFIPTLLITMPSENNIVDDAVPSDFIPTLLITMPSENSGSICSVAPSCSPPKQNTLTPLISVAEDCNHVLEDVQFNDDADERIETRLTSDRFCDDVSKTSSSDNIVIDVPSGFILSDNSVEDGLNAEKNIDADAPSCLPPSDGICQSETQTGSYSYLSEESIAELEQRISRLKRLRSKLKKARLGLS
jgi:hypothetical protein